VIQHPIESCEALRGRASPNGPLGMTRLDEMNRSFVGLLRKRPPFGRHSGAHGDSSWRRSRLACFIVHELNGDVSNGDISARSAIPSRKSRNQIQRRRVLSGILDAAIVRRRSIAAKHQSTAID